MTVHGPVPASSGVLSRTSSGQSRSPYFPKKELQLFLENICCDLLRFEHSACSGLPPGQVRITQEVSLGDSCAYADIYVSGPDIQPYFVEVKYGCQPEELVRSVLRKYGRPGPSSQVGKLLVVVDSQIAREWKRIERELRQQLPPSLTMELWDEDALLRRFDERFQVNLDHLGTDNVADVRAAIDRAKGSFAFGGEFVNDPLQESLLWHLSFWQLRTLIDQGLGPRDILAPGLYRNVAVIFADLSGFSSLVRDTRDEAVVRYILTKFYSQSRYEVINRAGMLLQFLGDGILGLFGLFSSDDTHLQATLDCAIALNEIGSSVSHEWQRHIDGVHESAGCHVGIALGDIQFMAFRPFSRTHIGGIGDSINLAARLSSAARDGEVVVSNTFYQGLPPADQQHFECMEPVDAKNIGRVRSWRIRAGSEESSRPARIRSNVEGTRSPVLTEFSRSA